MAFNLKKRLVISFVSRFGKNLLNRWEPREDGGGAIITCHFTGSASMEPPSLSFIEIVDKTIHNRNNDKNSAVIAALLIISLGFSKQI